jgi:hypothetical protein
VGKRCVKKEKKMIVVSGCPRSGTSLMMDCLRTALGDDRIIGKQFPQNDRKDARTKRRHGESDIDYNNRLYLLSRSAPKQSEGFEEMNPNGFWECRYSVRGIRWHQGINVKPTDVCKIVSQGLASSDPQYITKVIYMARHPRAVAKSQEKLRRMQFISREEEQTTFKIHSPDMFLQVTAKAAQWLNYNSTVPVLLVNYDDLIEDPDKELSRVAQFIGEGDFTKHPVDKKLRRSYPQEVDNPLWEVAEIMFKDLLQQNWRGIIQTYRGNVLQINKDKLKFKCLRTGQGQVYNECLVCKKNKETRVNYKKKALDKGIDWEKAPCVFECLYDCDNPHISIEDSIANNFWKD